ncbi:hypothetical protein VW23_008350 [Devosia insulae DS-56]|uniref:DUF202 domain-containing protein n=1 Tax=Devosia insulae DS-56 TaxID=1116389 RepID=A0A1E5XWW8_9HYPH|nr:hypothetical protein VW23_008350 [Devosia insulae DS-56]
MAFQRTRMAADRTMMAVIRTSLSLISFGFTIYKLIEGMQGSKLVELKDHASRNFGLTLIGIGMAALVAGIIYQLRFMAQLKAKRRELEQQGSIHAETDFPGSFNLVLAVLLLLVGVFAVISIVFRIGPF